MSVSKEKNNYGKVTEISVSLTFINPANGAKITYETYN
jgi:hypothetical protein